MLHADYDLYERHLSASRRLDRILVGDQQQERAVGTSRHDVVFFIAPGKHLLIKIMTDFFGMAVKFFFVLVAFFIIITTCCSETFCF